MGKLRPVLYITSYVIRARSYVLYMLDVILNVTLRAVAQL